MSDPKTEPVVDCSNDKILTKQSFKKETDINHIMARFVKTGIITPEALASRQATFADVSEIGDFLECQMQIKAAESAFMTLPADLRSRFQNQPAQLLDFMKDEKNRDEAIELGIITKPEEPAPEPTSAPEPTTVVPPEGTEAPKEG